MTWKDLLNGKRRKPKTTTGKTTSKLTLATEVRTEIERDYDRILFSTPVRRLADKTQVFPLERNASVRTRLTHSHEASNLARSIGVNLAFKHGLFNGYDPDGAKRDVPALLAAIGLAHDLGNPPFGHQGEHAIQGWFRRNRKILFATKYNLTESMKQDFLRFEGNAQTLRLLTRLQLINDDYGLNLTYGTLAALMKYPVPSNQIDVDHAARKKHGYFQSELDIVKDIWQHTGLAKGKRHPLTYVMEACDDIAYSVLDAEDAVKKTLVSFQDLLAYLRHNGRDQADPRKIDLAIEEVCKYAENDHSTYRELSLSPSELNDISMQKFRVYAIAIMVSSVTRAFLKNSKAILSGTFTRDLISVSDVSVLCKTLKRFDRAHAYKHRSVLEVELTGYNTLTGLMDLMWRAITERSSYKDLGSDRTSPFAAYAYQRISENYRRIFEDKKNGMPIRYKEMQLLTDMISGMTDSFAVDLHNELKQYAH